VTLRVGPRHVVVTAVLGGLVALASGPTGCGGGAVAPAKSGAAEPEIDTVEDALGALDDAEAELRLALGGAGAGDDGMTGPPGAYPQPYAQPPPGQPAPAPPPEPAEPQAGGQEPSLDREEEARAYSPESPCQVACRALASMERAALRLCELSGQDDARCVRAQERLDQAQVRVESSCSTCST
jgi:hypothetical protein